VWGHTKPETLKSDEEPKRRRDKKNKSYTKKKNKKEKSYSFDYLLQYCGWD